VTAPPEKPKPSDSAGKQAIRGLQTKPQCRFGSDSGRNVGRFLGCVKETSALTPRFSASGFLWTARFPFRRPIRSNREKPIGPESAFGPKNCAVSVGELSRLGTPFAETGFSSEKTKGGRLFGRQISRLRCRFRRNGRIGQGIGRFGHFDSTAKGRTQPGDGKLRESAAVCPTIRHGVTRNGSNT
jgi:hypothetical protein